MDEFAKILMPKLADKLLDGVSNQREQQNPYQQAQIGMQMAPPMGMQMVQQPYGMLAQPSIPPHQQNMPYQQPMAQQVMPQMGYQPQQMPPWQQPRGRGGPNLERQPMARGLCKESGLTPGQCKPTCANSWCRYKQSELQTTNTAAAAAATQREAELKAELEQQKQQNFQLRASFMPQPPPSNQMQTPATNAAQQQQVQPPMQPQVLHLTPDGNGNLVRTDAATTMGDGTPEWARRFQAAQNAKDDRHEAATKAAMETADAAQAAALSTAAALGDLQSTLEEVKKSVQDAKAKASSAAWQATLNEEKLERALKEKKKSKQQRRNSAPAGSSANPVDPEDEEEAEAEEEKEEEAAAGANAGSAPKRANARAGSARKAARK